MGYIIIRDDITKIKADIIVNASNGIGSMGGIIGRYVKLKGVAESIHYTTKGVVEKEAIKAAKKSRYLPRYLCGHKPGEIFVTGSGNLGARYIIHAVTMRYPGMRTNIDVIRVLLPKILSRAYELKAESLLIPLLGTGTGKLLENEVLKLYEEFFKDIKDIKIILSLISNF